MMLAACDVSTLPLCGGQDVCVVLELRDATLLVSSLRKMAAVVAAIPRLEAFVAQVHSSWECLVHQTLLQLL